MTVAGTLIAQSASIGVDPNARGNETFDITPSATTPISVNGGSDTDGDNTLNFNADGQDVTIAETVLNKVATYTITAAGMQPVTFTNIEKLNITNEVGGGSLTQNLDPAATTTVVTPVTGPISYGQSATFTADVTTFGGSPPDGSVQFFVDGAAYGSAVALVPGTATAPGTAQIAITEPAGSYTIAAQYLGDTNFAATLPAGETTAALTVSPASLTVTASNESMTYGGAVPALAYTYTGLVNGDTSASFTGGLTTTANSSSPVGQYSITESTLAATGNYTIGTFDAGTLTVSAASLTVTASNESMTYGGAVPALAYTYTGLVNGDTSASFTGGLTTTANSSSPAGQYSITESTLAATGNYTIGTFDAGTLTVSAASLTVTASNESMTYGGAVPALAYTYTGLVNGDTSASFTGGLTTTANSSSPVGQYSITESTLAATGNYTIGTFDAGTLTVTRHR